MNNKAQRPKKQVAHELEQDSIGILKGIWLVGIAFIIAHDGFGLVAAGR
jgi:hypothetical protein